ncbi:MAG: transglycosylase domain-containing protein [Cytophagales bacterium]|nr:transglycosylase domain-containing protein [Cytophagales bacterium]
MNKLKRNIKKLWVILLSGITFIAIFIISVNYNVSNLFGGMPSLQDLEKPESELSSELYSSDNILLGKYFRYNRSPVKFDELSDELVTTLLVTEDIRFYNHSGIDLKGLVRATYGVIKNIATFGSTGLEGGGSTITQQLAKNLFKIRREKKGKLSNVPFLGLVISKVKEWIVAVKLEEFYSKKEILAMYLNTAEYGSNSYGIKVAAKTYFNKEPSQLNYNESSIIVGLLNKPTKYNPFFNPENATNKRSEIFYNLYKYNIVDKTEYDSLILTDLNLNYKVQNQNVGQATYFRTVVRNYLISWAKENGYDLFSDGLKIYTTINSKMQEHAEKAVIEQMNRLQNIFSEHWDGRNPWIDEKGFEIKDFLKNNIQRTRYFKNLLKNNDNDTIKTFELLNKKKKMRVFSWKGEIDTTFSIMDSLKYYKKFLQAGFVSIEPKTGHIKAWVGGINHKYFKYDHVKQGKRQPGSTIKPIVYAAAIDNGYSPCYPVVDAPVVFELPGQDPPYWRPDNHNGKWTGETMTLRQAMAKSVNSITAFMTKKLSPKTVVDYAKKLGIQSKLDPVPAVCLGAGGDVSLFDLVGAYSTFINKGIWTEPFFISRIEDKYGNLIQDFIPTKQEALSEETAYLMLHMLKGSKEEEGGTARGLNPELTFNNDVGAKTGTTQNASDGWFIGVTHNLVSGAWVGGDDRSIHFRNWVYGQGARTAMPIWQQYMLNVYADNTLSIKKGRFDKPTKKINVEIDCSVYNNEIKSDSLNLILDKIDASDIF